jgi:hypothetical protein
MLIPPLSIEEAGGLTLEKGPNILRKPFRGHSPREADQVAALPQTAPSLSFSVN